MLASLNPAKLLPGQPLLVRWLLSSVLVSLAVLALVGASLNHLPPQVPLFYSNPWGKQQLASVYFLFLPQVLSFTLLALNLTLAKTFFANNALAKQALFISGTLVVLLSSVTVLRIILLVS